MPHNYNLRSTHAAPAAPAAPESLFFNETSPFHDVFNPTTKVTATKKSLWRMYAADKTRELFD